MGKQFGLIVSPFSDRLFCHGDIDHHIARRVTIFPLGHLRHFFCKGLGIFDPAPELKQDKPVAGVALIVKGSYTAVKRVFMITSAKCYPSAAHLANWLFNPG